MSRARYVYEFAEGSKDMRDLLGGKGANLAEMTRVLGPARVPAGFTVTTEACVEYMRAGRNEPEGLAEEVADALRRLEEHSGKRLRDDADPLRVSVRSGARESMPGMLDTVLNLGLNDTSVQGLATSTENERFAWDSYRRFAQMFGNVTRGIPGERLEDAIARAKERRGVKHDTELRTESLKELTDTFKAIYRDHTGEDFPQDPREQLRLAIRAAFDSWMGERAVAYRRINRIPDDWGTAVNGQQMVFGNKGGTSGSGVAFSRDEITGGPEPSGDFLPNAQGEDVVSGVRTPRDIAEMQDWPPEVHAELMEILRTLEAHYKDMQDTEFTVEEPRLYMLQTRNAKRLAQAAVRFAVGSVNDGLLTREEAIATIDAGALDALLHPIFDPRAEFEVLATGVAASPGAAKGEVMFSAVDAVRAAEDGRAVILVRAFTDADDVAGFHAATGILTSEGGKASHAALVARGMGRPAVVGVEELSIDLKAKRVSINGTELGEGDRIAIDGTTGRVTDLRRAARRGARGAELRARARVGGRDPAPTITIDQGIRRDTTLEALAALKPAFKEDGTVTAGNSSQICDGAAAVLLMAREKADELGLTPRARIFDATTVGVDPVIMLTGPIPATRTLLERNKMTIGDLDLIEINEAFASVVCAWRRELDPDMDRVNVNGGALALGHPLGSSGARLLTTLLHELERSDGELGLVTMCTAGGTGTGTLIQRI